MSTTSNETIYLIYDKFGGGNSSFNNKLTQDETSQTLFSSDYKYLQNEEALKEFNKTKEEIPKTVIDHNGLYTLYYFGYIKNRIEYRIMIVGVNCKLLTQYFKTKGEIPEKDFLRKLCNFDNLYKMGGIKINDKQEKAKKTTGRIKEIIKNCVVPNADPTDPIIPSPSFCKVPLYTYQKKTIKWMLTRELNVDKYNPVIEDVLLGDIVYDSRRRDFIDINNAKNVQFFGGALIDEVGLGKTYQMITTSLLNPCKEYSGLKSKATLVICPNQLVGQWQREIINVIKEDSAIKVIPYFTKVHFDKYTYKDLLNADFVITSFNFLSNKCFLNSFMENISTSPSYLLSDSYSYTLVEKEITNKTIKTKENLKNEENNSEACILYIDWHRIIVDEFHELYCVGKYKHVSILLKHFKGFYRWCLTGTPFDKSDSGLLGMIDFVTNYTSQQIDKEYYMDNELIYERIKKYFFRRNTKQSVIEENKLLPLIEKVVWLNFSNTERMMYNAYAANNNVDKFSVTLRQLCCHPKIAEDIKTAVSECASLEQIENTMIKFYENEMRNAYLTLKKDEYRLECYKRKKEIILIKQYSKTLKSKGFYIEYKFSDHNQVVSELKALLSANDVKGLMKFPKFSDELENDKENEGKKLRVLSEKDRGEIYNIANTKEETQELVEIKQMISTIELDIASELNAYKGKKATFEYFADVMEKLRQISSFTDADLSDSDDDESNPSRECGVCLGNITGHDLGMTICGHVFCYNCIKPIIESKGKCPLCDKQIKKQELFMVVKNKEENETQEEFKDKKELVKRVGTKLANLIFFLKKNDKHCIIFSQWDDLLVRVGNTLNEYNIKNVFCKGNVWQRDKAIREFNSDDKIKVIMLSSESAASGTNLTKAEMVILLDPTHGSYEYRRNTEWQAIGRAYRTGQTKQVQVIRFIIKNTVEEEIYEANQKEDAEAKRSNVIVEIDEKSFELESTEIKNLMEKATEKAKETAKKPIVQNKTLKKIMDNVDDGKNKNKNDDSDEPSDSSDSDVEEVVKKPIVKKR
jgi:SNF2 family DNA or RNA helicase